MKRKRNKGIPSTSPAGDFYFAAVNGMRLDGCNEATLETPTGKVYFRSGSFLQEELLSQKINLVIGALETNAIGCAATTIARFDLPSGEKDATDHEKSMRLLQWWNHIELAPLLLSFWCVKDNAVSPDTTFLASKPSNGETRFATYTIGVHCLDAEGRSAVTTWSQSELRQVALYHAVLHRVIREYRIHEDGQPHTFAQRSRSRVGRFFHILSATARREIDLALRIAFFVQALEVLFATTTSELTYRLSLRIAFALSDSPNGRAEIFDLMKEAYSTRSTMMHGDAFKPGQVQKLPGLCRRIEGVVRDVARLILVHPQLLDFFEKKSDDLEEAFTSLVIKPGESIYTVTGAKP